MTTQKNKHRLNQTPKYMVNMKSVHNNECKSNFVKQKKKY